MTSPVSGRAPGPCLSAWSRRSPSCRWCHTESRPGSWWSCLCFPTWGWWNRRTYPPPRVLDDGGKRGKRFVILFSLSPIQTNIAHSVGFGFYREKICTDADLSTDCLGPWQTCSIWVLQSHSCPAHRLCPGWVWRRWTRCAPPPPSAPPAHWAAPRIHWRDRGSATFLVSSPAERGQSEAHWRETHCKCHTEVIYWITLHIKFSFLKG